MGQTALLKKVRTSMCVLGFFAVATSTAIPNPSRAAGLAPICSQLVAKQGLDPDGLPIYQLKAPRPQIDGFALAESLKGDESIQSSEYSEWLGAWVVFSLKPDATRTTIGDALANVCVAGGKYPYPRRNVRAVRGTAWRVLATSEPGLSPGLLAVAGDQASLDQLWNDFRIPPTRPRPILSKDEIAIGFGWLGSICQAPSKFRGFTVLDGLRIADVLERQPAQTEGSRDSRGRFACPTVARYGAMVVAVRRDSIQASTKPMLLRHCWEGAGDFCRAAFLIVPSGPISYLGLTPGGFVGTDLRTLVSTLPPTSTDDSRIVPAASPSAMPDMTPDNILRADQRIAFALTLSVAIDGILEVRSSNPTGSIESIQTYGCLFPAECFSIRRQCSLRLHQSVRRKPDPL